MISVLSDMMSYTFIVRAMIVGGLVALCSALLGVSLVLKRYSMIGDGLSHVAFAALTIAVAMNVAPLYISVKNHLCDNHGFEIDSSKTVFYGTCKKCLKKLGGKND